MNCTSFTILADGDSEAPEPAYRISVKTLALLLEKRSNGTSLLDVGLGSLSLQDTRPDCPHSMYSQIIGGHTQQEEGTGGLREEELEAEEGQRASWWSLQKERKRLQPRSFSERSDEENNESTILPDLRVRVATQPLDGFDDMRFCMHVCDTSANAPIACFLSSIGWTSISRALVSWCPRTLSPPC